VQNVSTARAFLSLSLFLEMNSVRRGPSCVAPISLSLSLALVGAFFPPGGLFFLLPLVFPVETVNGPVAYPSTHR
jgi:hypothetical protein